MKKPLTGRKCLLLVVLLALTGVLPGQEAARKPPDPLSEDSLMARNARDLDPYAL